MNKAEKSLRWVANQIPDFKPATNEEKMLLAIKLYSEAGAEEIKRLEAENAALKERLGKAVELPKPFIEQDSDGYYRVYSSGMNIIRHAKQHGVYDTPEAAEARLRELQGEKE